MERNREQGESNLHLIKNKQAVNQSLYLYRNELRVTCCLNTDNI